MLTKTDIELMLKIAEEIGKNKAYKAMLEKVIELLKQFPHPMSRIALTELGDYICYLKDNGME